MATKLKNTLSFHEKKFTWQKIFKNERKEEHISTVPKGPFGNIVLVPRLDSVKIAESYVAFFSLLFFSFFLLSRISRKRQNLLFMRQMSLFTHSSGTTHILFIRPTVTLFRKNIYIKNGTHGTINTFKNYFCYSIFNFQFQQQ